jgi:AcrR family transcriptional regulator
MDSNNARPKTRPAITPQRRPGKARVAAVLAAAAAVIAEKGYDAATMAEIAVLAQAPIGSLYRFFPNKEILADALIQRYVVLVNEAFDALEQQALRQSTDFVADAILDFGTRWHEETKAMVGLLESRSDWSVRRREFRELVLGRIAGILRQRTSTLSENEARDVAVILLHHIKIMKSFKSGRDVPNSPGAAAELRRLTRWYVAHPPG